MVVRRCVLCWGYELLTSRDTALRRIIETITHRNTTKNIELIKLNQSNEKDQPSSGSIILVTAHGF